MSCGFDREEDFFYFFPIYIALAYGRSGVPSAWPVWTPGAWLTGFIKISTSYYYTQNIKKNLGFMVSEKKILCFPIVSLWELSCGR